MTELSASTRQSVHTGLQRYRTPRDGLEARPYRGTDRAETRYHADITQMSRVHARLKHAGRVDASAKY